MAENPQNKPATTLTAAHLRAARALLGYKQKHVAAETGISLSSLERYEARDPGHGSYANVSRLRAFYESAGIVFYESGNGIGVWWRWEPG